MWRRACPELAEGRLACVLKERLRYTTVPLKLTHHRSFAASTTAPTHPIMEGVDAGPDGRRLAANAGNSQAARREGGKSELPRAMCRITSGRAPSRALDGKCHREDTAPGASPR